MKVGPLAFRALALSMGALLVCFAWPPYARSQDHGHDHGNETSPEEDNAARLDMGARVHKAQTRFRGFGRYNRDFATFCSKLKLDGHGAHFLDWMSAESDVKRPDCRACQLFFRSFSQNCKKALQSDTRKNLSRKSRPSSKAVSEGSEAQSENPESSVTASVDSEKVKSQRAGDLEPRLAVIDAAVRLFSSIEGDKSIVEESLPAVRRFLEMCTSTPGHSVTERAYFDILSAFVQAVFAERFAQHHPETSPEEEKESSPPVDINELF